MSCLPMIHDLSDVYSAVTLIYLDKNYVCLKRETYSWTTCKWWIIFVCTVRVYGIIPLLITFSTHITSTCFCYRLVAWIYHNNVRHTENLTENMDGSAFWILLCIFLSTVRIFDKRLKLEMVTNSGETLNEALLWHWLIKWRTKRHRERERWNVISNCFFNMSRPQKSVFPNIFFKDELMTDNWGFIKFVSLCPHLSIKRRE